MGNCMSHSGRADTISVMEMRDQPTTNFVSAVASTSFANDDKNFKKEPSNIDLKKSTVETGSVTRSAPTKPKKPEITIPVSISAQSCGNNDEIEVLVLRSNQDVPDMPVRQSTLRRRLNQRQRDYIWGQTGGSCYICKEYLPKKSGWHIEHVVAFSKGPARYDVEGNMLPACATCNLKKLDRPLEECVARFACNLDTAAANASHLNTEARTTLLNALKVKRKLQYASAGDKPQQAKASVSASEMEAIEAESLNEIIQTIDKESQLMLSPAEFTFDTDHPFASGGFGEVYRGTRTLPNSGGTGPCRPSVASGVVEVAIKFAKLGQAIQSEEVKVLSAVARMSGDNSDYISNSSNSNSSSSSSGSSSSSSSSVSDTSAVVGHPHIVQFLGLLRHEEPAFDIVRIGLVFEFCPYDLSRTQVQYHADLIELLAQTAEALTWLHARHILHRDVKPWNILISFPSNSTTTAATGARTNVANDAAVNWSLACAKLGDFGSAKRVISCDNTEESTDSPEYTHNVGTASFRPKEAINGHYFPESDVFSFGMTIAAMKRWGLARLFRYRSAQLEGLEKLCKQCVEPEYKQRPTAQVVAKELHRLQKLGTGCLGGKSGATGQGKKGIEVGVPGSSTTRLPAVVPDAVIGTVETTDQDQAESCKAVETQTVNEVAATAAGSLTPSRLSQRKEEQELQPEDDEEQEEPESALLTLALQAGFGSEAVYVSPNAFIAPGDGSRRSMSFHSRHGCCKSTKVTTLATAMQCGHTPCRKCHGSGQSSELGADLARLTLSEQQQEQQGEQEEQEQVASTATATATVTATLPNTPQGDRGSSQQLQVSPSCFKSTKSPKTLKTKTLQEPCVYVMQGARLSVKGSGVRGLTYHYKYSCHMSCVPTTVDIATKFKHTLCPTCAARGRDV